MSAAGPPEGSNLLELVPFRIAGWADRDGRVVLEIPPPRRRWLAPLAWLGFKGSSRRVRLDDVGSLAWHLFDGRRTVGQVAVALRERFADRVEPAEERLATLVRAMHRGGLVGYQGYDEPAGSSDPR